MKYWRKVGGRRFYLDTDALTVGYGCVGCEQAERAMDWHCVALSDGSDAYGVWLAPKDGVSCLRMYFHYEGECFEWLDAYLPVSKGYHDCWEEATPSLHVWQEEDMVICGLRFEIRSGGMMTGVLNLVYRLTSRGVLLYMKQGKADLAMQGHDVALQEYLKREGELFFAYKYVGEMMCEVNVQFGEAHYADRLALQRIRRMVLL